MITPIKKKPPESNVSRSNITDTEFKELIAEIYDIMIHYSRIKQKMLHKEQPMLIGNVTFWFETNAVTKEPQMRFSTSVSSWNISSIRTDIQQFTHELYYGLRPS